jgi:hypothetical protein
VDVVVVFVVTDTADTGAVVVVDVAGDTDVMRGSWGAEGAANVGIIGIIEIFESPLRL